MCEDVSKSGLMVVLGRLPSSTDELAAEFHITSAKLRKLLMPSPYVIAPFCRESVQKHQIEWSLSSLGMALMGKTAPGVAVAYPLGDLSVSSSINLTTGKTNDVSTPQTDLKSFQESQTTSGLRQRVPKKASGYGDSLVYREYLRALPEEIQAWQAIRCGKHGGLYRCVHDGMAVFKPHHCTQRHYCVHCGDTYATVQSLSTMRTLNVISQHVPYLALSFVTFTLPPALWSVVDYGGFGKLSGIIRATMKEYHGGMPAGLLSAHTWHSSRPLRGWYPHIHSFWLSLVFNKKLGKFVPRTAFIDVNKLRRIYLRRLNEAFGTSFESVDLHVSYVRVSDKTRPQIYHHLRYMLRLPQGDVVNFTLDSGLKGYDTAQTNHLNRILAPPSNWRRTRWCGWLSDSVRGKYLAMLGIALDELEEPEPDHEVRCPLCGSLCEFLEDTTVEQLRGKLFVYPAENPGGFG